MRPVTKTGSRWLCRERDHTPGGAPRSLTSDPSRLPADRNGDDPIARSRADHRHVARSLRPSARRLLADSRPRVTTAQRSTATPHPARRRLWARGSPASRAPRIDRAPSLHLSSRWSGSMFCSGGREPLRQIAADSLDEVDPDRALAAREFRDASRRVYRDRS
jgi:hypothetical protein